MSLLSKISEGYTYSLVNHYYPTQAVTMSAFATAGDALAQHRELVHHHTTTKAARFDLKRNRRFMLKGIGCGIIWSLWYKICENWSEMMTAWILLNVPQLNTITTNGMDTILMTISSMLLEQFIAAPVIYACWDLPILCLLNGRSVRSIPSVVRQKLPSFLLAHFKLWTTINVVIYTIPIQWRVFTQSFFEIIWEAIASTIASSSSSEEEEDDMVNGSKSKVE